MSAIITDQLRVLNDDNFAAGIKTSTNSYYSFINLPNATDVQSDWDTNVPDPKDSFHQEDRYWDTMIALKKIGAGDVKRVIEKLVGHLVQLMIIIEMIIVEIIQRDRLVLLTYMVQIIM